MTSPITNVIGFDDAPFPTDFRGNVRLVGTICARTRLDGVVSGWVRRDGVNATQCMIEVIRNSQFNGAVRAVLLQGIAVAGFNVVDIHRLCAELSVPVVVVTRRRPRMDRVKTALFHTPRAELKWSWIEAAGEMEKLDHVWVQRAGIGIDETRALIDATTLHGNLPEPLRLAHLIAGGVTTGKSRGRA